MTEPTDEMKTEFMRVNGITWDEFTQGIIDEVYTPNSFFEQLKAMSDEGQEE